MIGVRFGDCRKANKMSLFIVACLSVGFVGSLLAIHPASFSLIFTGSSSYGEGLGSHSLGWGIRSLLMGALLAVVLIPIGLTASVDIVGKQYREDKKKTETRAHLIRSHGEKLRGAIDSGLAQARVTLDQLSYRLLVARNLSSIREDLTEFTTMMSSTGDVLTLGYREGTVGELESKAAELHLIDPQTGQDKMILVVHLFEGEAYWDFGEPNLFVEQDDKTDFNLWRFLKKQDALDSIKQYDFIAGIGLESNSKSLSGALSADRAGFLCSGLTGLIQGTGVKAALGLDIGKYKGATAEQTSARDYTQRPVIIIGIDVEDESVEYSGIVKELLAEVKLSGLDLGMYEYLMPEQRNKAHWVKSPDCEVDYEFLHQ